MPESTQPFAASEVPSKHDITHPNDIDQDELSALHHDDIGDIELHFADDDAAPTSFEPPEDTAPVVPVALARVSFSEQATLSFDGYQETFPVTLLNLSTQGVACLGPHGLNVADTVRLAFPLSPGEMPASLLCEVMWSQPSTPREDAYGLRFTTVDPQLLARVEDIVRQRCHHPLAFDIGSSPDSVVAATVSSWSRSRLQVAPWVTASAGAAAGMLVTLAVMVLVESDLFAGPAAHIQPPTPVHAAANAGQMPALAPIVVDPAGPPAPAPAAATKPVVAANSAQPAKKSAPAAASKPAADAGPVAAASKPAAAAQHAAPAPEAPSAPAAADSAASARPKVRFVGDLQVEETANTVALTLRTQGPAALHEEFWLSQPRRLVVDVPAARNGLQGNAFDIDGPLVARVRVGDHADKVRFVIETDKNVHSKVQAVASGDTLRIEMRR